jgi:putative sigma-54 modulation protein
MEIIIQTPGFKADVKLLKFIKKRLDRLNKLHDSIVNVNVCLRLDNADTQENKVCEIKLGVPGKDLFANRQNKTFEAAVINVCAALKRQLTDLKKDYKGQNVPGPNA